jgi:hypothetical protein
MVLKAVYWTYVDPAARKGTVNKIRRAIDFSKSTSVASCPFSFFPRTRSACSFLRARLRMLQAPVQFFHLEHPL